MPGIVDTPDLNSAIAHMTEDARKFILVVSPYLKINDRLRRTLAIADTRGVKTFFIYGKKEMNSDTYDWIKTLENSSIAFIPQLHAKLYLMEFAGIIMTMNLYTFSQVNNEELGVIFEKKYNRSDFKELVFHSLRLIDSSKKEYGPWDDSDIRKLMGGIFSNKFKKPIERSMYDTETEVSVDEQPILEDSSTRACLKSPQAEVISETTFKSRRCHCIRCGRIIPSDHPFVYCGRCLESWKKYSNFGYTEQQGHCYICNKENRSSADRPACSSCYASNKDFVIAQCDRMRSECRK